MGNRQIGILGEKLALNFLLKNGYSLIEKNFRFGKNEIDIIAKKHNKYVFIEVKTRTNIIKGKPYESVTYRKQQTIRRAAEFFVLKNIYLEIKKSRVYRARTL